MENHRIAELLDQYADLLEFQQANAFRVRAYRNAARKIKDHLEPIAAVLEDADRKLTDISGIGKEMAEKIASLVATGTFEQLEKILEEVPESVLKLLRIPGLGPKKAAVLYNELKITTLDELRAACEQHTVRELKGFGAKTEQTIYQGLDLAERADARIYWRAADEVVELLREHLEQARSIKRLEVAGSYRRGKETVGDLDFLVEASGSQEVMDLLAEFPQVADVIARGETKMSVRLESDLQVDLRVVPKKSFGAALVYFTGSKDHNVVLRGRAKQQGLRINEWGVFRLADDSSSEEDRQAEEQYVAGKQEQDVYQAVGLPWIPPELREARQEFEWAENNALPELVTLERIRGDLHMHTTETDGKASLEEMVAAAQERGLEYIAITDHSKRVSMANGLDARRLRKQWKQIDQLNKSSDDILILKGIECDILENGEMDLADDVLAEADWVIASIHYGQNQPRAQITDRIVGALENPHVSVIAHPTGRLINRREAYEVDMEAVMKAAAKNSKLLELNANPARLDLNDIHSAVARQHGIPIVISTDAHSIGGLATMRYGILQARRAGLTQGDVANTHSWQQIQQMLGNG